MNTKDSVVLFNRFFLVILLISISTMMGCSPQYINIFATNAGSGDELVKPFHEEQVSDEGSADDYTDEEIDKEDDISPQEEQAIDHDEDKNSEDDIVDTHKDSADDVDDDVNNIDDMGNVDDIDNVDNVDNVDGTESSDVDLVDAIPAAKIITKSSSKELKRVAITFDDGPDDYFTPKVLDILKEYDAKATFFVLGSMGNINRDVLKRINDEGHVVGSHSWGHENFTKISEEKRINELEKTDNLIKEVLGFSTPLFRLPYGASNKGVLQTVANQGYHNIYWSIDPKDWSGKSSDQILDNVRQNIEPGAIILLHSSGNKNSIPNTVKALPRIIEFLLDQGYEIVTIPELLIEDISR